MRLVLSAVNYWILFCTYRCSSEGASLDIDGTRSELSTLMLRHATSLVQCMMFTSMCRLAFSMFTVVLSRRKGPQAPNTHALTHVSLAIELSNLVGETIATTNGKIKLESCFSFF